MVKSRTILAKIWDLVDPEIFNEQIRILLSYFTLDNALYLKVNKRYKELTLNNVLFYFINQYFI